MCICLHFCPMLHNDAYIEYFRWQCRMHPDLQHSASPGNRIFQVIDIEEALGDFRSGAKEKDFIFRLIMYTYGVRLDEANFVKQLQGGFVIAKGFSQRDTNHLQALYEAEQVTDHFISKMMSDSRAGHPLFFHSLDDGGDITAVPVIYTGDGAYAGWRVVFSFDNFFDDCIPGQNAPAWLDGGLSPFDNYPEEVMP